MKNIIKPIDLIAYNKIYLKKSWQWIESNPEICQRYLSRYWQLNFDLTSLKRRFVSYFKESK